MRLMPMLRRSLVPVTLWIGVFAILTGTVASRAKAAQQRFEIRPSSTDASIHDFDSPHVVIYDPEARPGKILLWLPGTNGLPRTGPQRIYRTALAQGYRVVALSYVDAPAVAQICTGADGDPDCARKFREKRVYGVNVTPVIDDEPQDAIARRFAHLLRYLAQTDPAGRWDTYLRTGLPRWDLVAVAGHSQGGGMAAFIAKHQRVARVVMFSGGWDQARPGVIAGWYTAPSATPPGVWFGAYHVREPNAGIISRIYRAEGLAPGHVVAFDLPLRRGEDPHAQGLTNQRYTSVWRALLGRGER